MCAAHLGKWGTLSSVAEELVSKVESDLSASVCELRDRYVRLDERRQFPRLPLNLPVQVRRVAGRPEGQPVRATTDDISCGGLYFVSSRKLAPGTVLDLEVVMADQPLGGPSIRMFTRAHVVRVSPTGRPGWVGVAAVFDDISFDRDPSPARQRN